MTPGVCPSSQETLMWLWRREPGWALVVDGKTARRCSTITGRVQALAVPSAKGRVESGCVMGRVFPLTV